VDAINENVMPVTVFVSGSEVQLNCLYQVEFSCEASRIALLVIASISPLKWINIPGAQMFIISTVGNGKALLS
jgi:hypothetical protein